MSIGLTRSDLVQMPWGEVVLLLQARASEYAEEGEPEVREASWEEIRAWI